MNYEIFLNIITTKLFKIFPSWKIKYELATLNTFHQRNSFFLYVTILIAPEKS